ncbi:MAG TPA: response regulator [Burkholderiaceae bacterium]|nr:response regulator [Burkholderiaceae bacterium]
MADGAVRYVLLVEDEQQIAEVFATILEEEGYETVRACDGANALRVLQTQPGRPALILTDLRMPRMNGFELCRRLASIPELADVPVVILSSTVDAANLPRLGNVKGAHSKPLGMDQLLACVAMWGSEARTLR